MDDQTTKYAGFWMRFVAYLIDGLIISLVEGFLILPLLAIMGFNAVLLDSMVDVEQMDWEIVLPALISAGIGLYLSVFLLTWLYYALMEAGPRQATIGKLVLRLKVTDADGNRLTFPRASLRYFSKIISSAVLMIGYIMAAFTARKQALHDIIANTYVIENDD